MQRFLLAIFLVGSLGLAPLSGFAQQGGETGGTPPRGEESSSSQRGGGEEEFFSSESSSAAPVVPEEEASSSVESSSVPASSRMPRSLPPSSSSAVSSSVPSSSARSSSMVSSSVISSSSSRRQSSAAVVMSSSRSSSSAASLMIAMPASVSSSSEALSWFARERLGYSVPVIPEGAIKGPADISLQPEAIAGNLFFALLIALVMGFSGILLKQCVAMDEKRMQQVITRLPFQAIVTAVLIWIIHPLIPAADAQGLLGSSSLSLFHIPLYALLFFLVVGFSNYLFNNLLSHKGVALSKPLLRWLPGGEAMNERKWFVVLLILLYGIIGAHINPEVSLWPAAQVGIVVVAVIGILLSVCLKDLSLYGIARRWRLLSSFQANITGFAVALICILVSRAFNLTPGYIFGIPVVFLVLSTLARNREGLFESIGMAWLLVLAALAWVLAPMLGGYPILLDLTNLLFVIIIEDAFFEMFPLPHITGGIVYRWKRWLWFVLFAVVVFFLLHTMFNPQGTVASLAQTPPAAVTVLLLGCYAVGAMLLWLYIRRGRKKLTAA